LEHKQFKGMSAGHEHWHDRGEIYALGALDGQELKEFEAHLASGCAICEAYVRETRETLAVLHRSLRPETPPLAIKARVLDQIAPQAITRTRQEKTPWFNWNWWGLGIGAAATAAVALVLTSNLTRTQSELEKAKAQLAAAQIESAQKDELLQLLSSQEVRLVELKGLEAAPAAKAKLFWNPGARSGILLINGLPMTPSDRAYELWGIAGTEPVPAGVFRVDDQGQARFRMPILDQGKNFDKFAVTLEPAAGVEKPSGPMVLLGSL
jgi:anti-sigma-K factor RskA